MPDTDHLATTAQQHTANDSSQKDYFSVRNGVRFAGVHLIIDCYDAQRLDDIDFIEQTLIRCISASNATLINIHLHHFHPNGVSGVAVLAESHISVHTWPASDFATLVILGGTFQSSPSVKAVSSSVNSSLGRSAPHS